MRKLKKDWISYGICSLLLVLLCSLMSACNTGTDKAESQESEDSSQLTEESGKTAVEADWQNEESQLVMDHAEEEEAREEEAKMVSFTVEPGEYVSRITERLAEEGYAESAEELIQMLESMDRSKFVYWSQMENADSRAFAAEGYIAPGTYTWKEGAEAEEILLILMGSWDAVITDEMAENAKNQGYSVDQILIMASIVEWESSFDPNQIVKPQVAAVVRNRIESDTALQMDVTVFYLQQALWPYRDPDLYEEAYDTYIRSTLPAGPIGSPSLESIQAVLNPADTQDLFFVYDEEGRYYFAEDYEQHLQNCELAGII